MTMLKLGHDRTTEYTAGQTFGQFLGSVTENADLWRALARRASVPDDLDALVRRVPGNWNILVLLEDWCGDAVNIVPVLARLVERSASLSMRVLRRDQNLGLMDQHLTNGKRAIPVVMILDDHLREVAWWGPRPRELQQWATTLGLSLGKPDRYREMRRWYATDRGRTTLSEVIQELCHASGVRCGQAAA